MTTLDVRIQNVVTGLLKVNPIEDAFSMYLTERPEDLASKRQVAEQELGNIFAEAQGDLADLPLKQLVSCIAGTSNRQHSKLLFSLLEHIAANNIVPPRKICDTLLACEKLTPSNSSFWQGSFGVIRAILNQVDYKGVREIMKTCLEKAPLLSQHFSPSQLPNVKALASVLQHIFDRNACLLPAYFVMNEIQKLYPDNKSLPHWEFAGILSDMVDSFRPLVQMLTPIGRHKCLPLVDQSLYGYQGQLTWKLEQGTLKYILKGNLPYSKEITEPQVGLVRYILKQPYSRDMLSNMLGLQKQQKQRHVLLEEQLVWLLVEAMEEAEKKSSPALDPNMEEGSNVEPEELGVTYSTWNHLASQIIYFVLFQFASFPHLVNLLYEKLTEKGYTKGRDQLMWSLLQFVSGSIQKNPLTDFLPVLRLFELLYPETEPIPVPDVQKPQCVHHMAAACIWIHMVKKAQIEQQQQPKEGDKPKEKIHLLNKPVPVALQAHHEFLVLCAHNPPVSLAPNDYRIALLCNAFSTTLEWLARPMGVLMETTQGTSKSLVGGDAASGVGNAVPLPVAFLDALTVHAKMSLIHSIVSNIIKGVQTKMSVTVSPTLLETYSRLLVYTEIESLGIKGFISQVMSTVFKAHCWGILHTLVEMFSYRVHHIQSQYRLQLLTQLHMVAAVPQTNQVQLNICLENAALRLITGLGVSDLQPHSRVIVEIKSLVSQESEELNRAMVLTLARILHVAGVDSTPCPNQPNVNPWYKELVLAILQNTPHAWASNTIACFPQALADIFLPTQNLASKESKQQIKLAVEDEYRRWCTMTSESEIVAHFSNPGSPPLFLCLLWKMLLETQCINPVAYAVLERIGARGLAAHLRTFCDFLVYEFANSGGGQHVTKCIDVMNELVWVHNIVSIDRVVLCLALRPLEGNEAQVCFFIIQLLLLKPHEFRSRVQEFVKENSPDHWRQSSGHEKHVSFQRKFPEKFGSDDNAAMPTPYPVYFGNVCVRFLPVFDIVIHRFLELPPVSKSLETILEHLGALYKFHDRPVTYLYNTLHYYERKLRDRTSLKRKLVSSILGALKEVRPPQWGVSEAFQNYLARPVEDLNWNPELEYYSKLVGRVVDGMQGKATFVNMDWRFCEFPNAASHALHIVCVELLALPCAPSVVANALIDVIIKCYASHPKADLEAWVNAVGLILTCLPEAFHSTLFEKAAQLLESPILTNYRHRFPSITLMNYTTVIHQALDANCALMLALQHAFFTQAHIGQLAGISQFVKERICPLVKTEEQYLWVCHWLAPSLLRFHAERTKFVFDLTVNFYELLEQVDKHVTEFYYMDTICDLLYHIKYMFTGDQVKSDVEPIIRNLRPALRLRLRFISHLNLDDIQTS